MLKGRQGVLHLHKELGPSSAQGIPNRGREHNVFHQLVCERFIRVPCIMDLQATLELVLRGTER